MRTDFHRIEDGHPVLLHPADANFMHRAPLRAFRVGFRFYAVSGADDKPIYTTSDVSAFCRGWEPADQGVAA